MPLVLDTGALIGLERGSRTVALALDEFRGAGQPVIIPAGALAQAWRSGRRQASIAALLKATDVSVEALSAQIALLSSDPDDLERLDPDIHVIEC